MTGPPDAGSPDAGRRRADAPAADAVTGALTREALLACVEDAIGQARDSGGACSLFLFDVDHFKSVNDAYGHARGDAVLREIAERTTDLVRRTDVLVRYGGDEFVLILPDTGRQDAVQVGMRLVDGIKGAAFAGNPPLSVSISLGLATFPDEAATRDELLEVADRRNYLAKRRGRGRAVGDDMDAGGHTTAGRLLERDAELAAAQDFLVRLAEQGRGTLCVTGQRGAGHSRFLAEVANLARLRGFEIHEVGGARPAGNPVLIVADTDTDPDQLDRAVRALTGSDATVGLIHASPDNQAGPDRASAPITLPTIATINLPPLSDAALGVWLRTTLRGEPSPALVEWLATRSGGLIAAAERELARLVERGDLEQGGNGGWSIAAAVLSRAANARRRLPAALTTLIGRDREIAQVTALLANRRLVTMVGPGGIGKTRLAVAVAGAIAEEYDDGAVFVPLAEATTADLVVSAVATALEITEVAGEQLVDTIVERLTGRNLLLVLDNFEQVLAAAPVVARLLAVTTGVRVLATSQQRLRLSGEQVYPVPPLPLPDLDHLPARPADVASTVAASPALALFVARAREAAFDLRLTPADVRAAAEICHHLDGLPLAIELAAARCDTLTPTELRHQLTARFELLTDGPQDLPQRQQTLRATIDWSFALLAPADQDLLIRLAVFAGGCQAEAVVAVCGGEGVAADRLQALVDSSLLTVASTPDGDRYTMLESIRAYAAERLAASSFAAEVHGRHTEYFAIFAERAGPELVKSAQAEWTGRLSREYHNLRAAIEDALSRYDATTAARLAVGLSRYWYRGRNRGDGWACLQRVLAVRAGLPDRLHARLAQGGAYLSSTYDEEALTWELAEECHRIAQRLGDLELIAAANGVLGFAAELSGDQERNAAYQTEALEIQQKRGDKLGIAVARGNLTLAKLALGDLDTANELALLNLDLEREIGNLRGVAMTLSILGDIRVMRGDAAGARPLTAESLRIYQQIGDVSGEAWSTFELAMIEQMDGDTERAYRGVTAAIRLMQTTGSDGPITFMAVDLANVLSGTDPARAGRLLAATEALQEKKPPSEDRHKRWEETRERIAARLTEGELATVWAAGRATPLTDAIADALAAPVSQ